MDRNKSLSPTSFFFIVILAVFIGSCSNNLVTKEAPPLDTVAPLIPFLSSEPTTIIVDKTKVESNQSVTIVPSLTPTPELYTIIEGDTLTSIAFRQGVKLNELLTANPGIDPNFLSVGTEITIPRQDDNIVSAPNPTPIPLKLGAPIIYTVSNGGSWCFALLENTQDFPVENISGLVHVESISGGQQPSQIAVPPINIIPPKLIVPIIAYFPNPIPEDAVLYIEMMTVLPVPENDLRYLDLTIETEDVLISDDQSKATLNGFISIDIGEISTERVYISLIAYGEDGKPVGIRKIELDEPIHPREKRFFEISVYSLGPKINDVVIFGEAR